MTTPRPGGITFFTMAVAQLGGFNFFAMTTARFGGWADLHDDRQDVGRAGRYHGDLHIYGSRDPTHVPGIFRGATYSHYPPAIREKTTRQLRGLLEACENDQSGDLVEVKSLQLPGGARTRPRASSQTQGRI